MTFYPRARKLAPVLALSVLAAACSSALLRGRGELSSRAPAGQPPAELPWEVIADNGDAILPNVFYAEDSENEQIMPLALSGGRPLIDRLIYPTLGNPALAVKTRGKPLTVVLRLEDRFLVNVGLESGAPSARPGWNQLELKDQADASDVQVHLVARSLRESVTEKDEALPDAGGDGDYRLYPREMLVRPIDEGMPEAFARRRTVRLGFDAASLAQVPEGLYDLRFEVHRGGALVRDDDGRGVEELQYNAVRVFDQGPEKNGGRYTIINLADTQITVGNMFEGKTLTEIKNFVAFVNSGASKKIAGAAFIVFSGDLHDSGSPDTLSSPAVADTYRSEAAAIVGQLKNLPLPIFLTPGNHDGYVSMGHVPELIALKEKVIGKSMDQVVEAAQPTAWPGITRDDFDRYVSETGNAQGGRHVDVVTGRFARRPGATTFHDGWVQVPESRRNVVLYDGFYQWQRTYGPLYRSWSFGGDTYLGLNSFELRQHRRSGWGMYVVNYGGGMSPVQLEWVRRELDRAQSRGRDVTIVEHQDPRGGHYGQDFSYYFSQIDYTGISLSAGDYVIGEAFAGYVCQDIPNGDMPRKLHQICQHEGLEEWMRPDPEFDCSEDLLSADGTCQLPPGKHYWYSGFALIDQIARHPAVRTLLLGHTHYNALEVFQSGQELLPASFGADQATADELARLEASDPLRHGISSASIQEQNRLLRLDLTAAGAAMNRALSGAGRELAILHTTCDAGLANQNDGKQAMFGFNVMSVYPASDSRGYAPSQINSVEYWIHSDATDPAQLFKIAGRYKLRRDQPLAASDPANPINRLFQYSY